MNPQHTPSHRTHRRKTSDHSVPQISFASSVFTLFVNKLSSRWGILTLFVLLYVAWSFFAGDTPAVSTTLSTINPEKRDDPTHRRPPIFPTELLNNPLTHYAHQRHKSHSHSLPINDVDLRYCGASSCRFLFPIFIGEQESKAQLHFQQLALLAATLNRTIVLPNAFKGLLASCSRLPFDHYFSTSTLDTLAAHGIRYITQSDLETWALERGEEIPAQFAFVELEPKSKPAGWKPPPIPNKKKLDKRFCLNAFPLDYQPYPVIQHFVAYGYERSRAEVALTRDAIVTALRDSAEAHGQRPGMTKDKKKETAPILLVHYQLRSPFMDVPVPGPPLEYNPKWHETTAAVVDRLRPFVAVHWRMETIPPQNLPACAARLVAHLHTLQSMQSLRNVYLLTDYPLEGKFSHSSTWKLRDVTEDHHEALRMLRNGTNVRTWMDLYKEMVKEQSQRRRLGKRGVEDVPDMEGYAAEVERAAAEDERVEDGLFDGVVPVDEDDVTPVRGSSVVASLDVTNDGLDITPISHQNPVVPDTITQQDPQPQVVVHPSVPGAVPFAKVLHTPEPFDPAAGDNFDPGLLGILDKLVAVQAEYFLAGPPGCAKLSSFTAHVVARREEKMEREGSWIESDNGEVEAETKRVLRNVLDQW